MPRPETHYTESLKIPHVKERGGEHSATWNESIERMLGDHGLDELRSLAAAKWALRGLQSRLEGIIQSISETVDYEHIARLVAAKLDELENELAAAEKASICYESPPRILRDDEIRMLVPSYRQRVRFYSLMTDLEARDGVPRVWRGCPVCDRGSRLCDFDSVALYSLLEEYIARMVAAKRVTKDKLLGHLERLDKKLSNKD